MELKKAMEIITESEKGFMVNFEHKEGSVLKSDHFPDKHAGEDLIKTEEEAWKLAERFAKATNDDFVNIYVVDQNHNPVVGYDEKELKPYPPLNQ